MYASRPGGGVVAAAELAQILRGFMHKNMFLICETRESINTYGISLIVGTLQRVVNADAYVSVFFDESDVKFSYCASADHWFRESPYEGFDFSSPTRVECYFDEPSIKAAITRLGLRNTSFESFSAFTKAYNTASTARELLRLGHSAREVAQIRSLTCAVHGLASSA